jgi:two-component system, chemotaxis family, sensor kinase CheA
MSESPTEKALQEFLSEAQEIVEAFNRDLLALDEQRAAGAFDPEVINDAFRAVHSLKGLSGLFGVTRMTSLSHNLENLLDSLRLGRVELQPATLDLLFEAVALFNKIIGETAGSAPADEGGNQVEDLIARLDRVVLRKEALAEASPWGGWDLDASLLSVLTEYEEHRLRENVKSGRMLYRIHAAFDLMTIDKGLDELKTRLKPVGEVITYLPSAEAANDQQIELDVILGAQAELRAVQEAVVGTGAVVALMPRKGKIQSAMVAPLVEPSAPASVARQKADVTAEEELTLKSVAQTVRVDIRKLDHLMNIVGELGIARAGLTQILDRVKLDKTQAKLARDLHHELRALSRRLDEMQAGILEVRMVPLAQVFDKLSRVVRKISRDAGKEIRLSISGADTELDMRNCIDHGIEPAAARKATGKADIGTITIRAEQRGNHVVVQIEDDGAGLDEQKLLRKAVESGLIGANEARDLGRRDVHNLIFLPGLSTKDTADELSGRGVGMDVVKTNIARLSGIIDVESEAGMGTRLTLTLPITLAIIQALIIRAAGRTFAVPLNSVLESLRITQAEVKTIERREVMSLRGQTLPLARLERMFHLDRDDLEGVPNRQYVVVVGLAQHRIGLLVDELIGQEDIVIKSLGRALSRVPGVAGATELGGKKTVLVLDVAQIVEEAVQSGAEAA